MELKWKQPITLQSQPKQNLKYKQDRGNALPNNVSTSSKNFSFLLPESSLVYYPFIPLLLDDGQLITNQINNLKVFTPEIIFILMDSSNWKVF